VQVLNLHLPCCSGGCSASTVYEVLLSVPQEPQVVDSWSKLSHSQAKLRGIEAKRLLSAEGGMLSTQEVASLLDISPRLSTSVAARASSSASSGPQPVLLSSLAVRATSTVAGLEGFLMCR